MLQIDEPARRPDTHTDSGFTAQLTELLRQARWGAARTEEVLATSARIRDRDPDSWVSEWVWTAGEAWAAANRAASRGTAAGAGARYLQAAVYYGAALSQIPRSAEHVRAPDLWRRHRFCWDEAVDRARAPARRIEIPYAGGSLPGAFFPAPGARGGRRPLVIMHNGAYGPTSAMWGLGGAAAARRGYHWMTFDGPGQQAALHERGLFFRTDWEHVLTAVLDAVIARPDVDAARIAAVGIGQAGYLLPRAMAYEHRLAAAVLAPGVVDVVDAWTAALPARLRAILARGATVEFDREMRVALLFAPEAAGTLRARAAGYGLAGASPSRIFATVGGYRLGEEAAAVRTPLLVVEAQPGAPWPGQSRRLAGLVAGPVSRSASHDEAAWLDWLERHLG
jgi:Esterase FrsA-like